MEDLLKIPGVFDRLVEAKILPATQPPLIPKNPIKTIAPTQQVVNVPEVPELIAPRINPSVKTNSKNEVKWALILLVGGIAAIALRYEIGYYVFGKPNQKYPGY